MVSPPRGTGPPPGPGGDHGGERGVAGVDPPSSLGPAQGGGDLARRGSTDNFARNSTDNFAPGHKRLSSGGHGRHCRACPKRVISGHGIGTPLFTLRDTPSGKGGPRSRYHPSRGSN